MKKLLFLLILLIMTSFIGCTADNIDSSSMSNVSIVVEPNNITSNNLNGYKDLTAKPIDDDKNDSQTSSINRTDAQYVGNKNSKKFHISNCTYVQKMKQENAVYFNTSDDAKSNGYKPCSKCNP